MSDYHSNDTIYVCTAANQVSTIRAPAGKVWDFDYDAAGQVSQYDHPNGMRTVYGYDLDGRLTSIEQ